MRKGSVETGIIWTLWSLVNSTDAAAEIVAFAEREMRMNWRKWDQVVVVSSVNLQRYLSSLLLFYNSSFMKTHGLAYRICVFLKTQCCMVFGEKRNNHFPVTMSGVPFGAGFSSWYLGTVLIRLRCRLLWVGQDGVISTVTSALSAVKVSMPEV